MVNQVPETPEEFVRVIYPIILQIHQCVFGVVGTEEDGMSGKLNDHDTKLAKHDDAISKNRRGIYGIFMLLTGLGLLGGGLWFFIFS